MGTTCTNVGVKFAQGIQHLAACPEVDTSSRIIKGYRVKRDASGEISKDKDGGFIFFPVYEDEQNEQKSKK